MPSSTSMSFLDYNNFHTCNKHVDVGISLFNWLNMKKLERPRSTGIYMTKSCYVMRWGRRAEGGQFSKIVCHLSFSVFLDYIYLHFNFCGLEMKNYFNSPLKIIRMWNNSWKTNFCTILSASRENILFSLIFFNPGSCPTGGKSWHLNKHFLMLHCLCAEFLIVKCIALPPLVLPHN